ncbi:MAG: YkgJ family cysteine cluster protein [Thermoplasmatales archaeon]|nr:MAG: YkgJ family cysteine cluster protein [Thermoplasmatales archaeon]
MLVSQRFLRVCNQCKAFCCTLLIPPVTEKEKHNILKAGFKNHFIKIRDDMYTIKSRDNGNCFYLKEDYSCGIHSVKPALCRVWPIIPRYHNNKRGCIVIKCPLYPLISKTGLKQTKKEAERIPLPIVQHLWNISTAMKERYKRFEYEEI